MQVKHVMVNDNVTADLFGTSKLYFDYRIKGKKLEILHEDWFFYIVRDDDHQVFYVPKDSASVVRHKEVCA